MTSTVHVRNASDIPPHEDLVRVGGRYRVGNLLGFGGSGESNPDFQFDKLSELSRECLPRERYQDRH